MNQKINQNGADTPVNKNQTEPKIDFPVSFELKVVVETLVSLAETQRQLDSMLLRLAVANEYLGVKESGKGKFASHTIRVLLLNQEHLDELYVELKKLPGLKFAV
jgi:putative lipoic acid-binding regulatory protein